jgi:hypothetical protein
MPESSPTQHPLAPRKAIRRFDVFAEVNRLEALKDGRPEDEAKGHGIWLAKVVAGRRFGRTGDGEGDRSRRRTGDEPDHRATPDFRSAGGELQTDETFDHEIVERMGREFYAEVFAPAIRAAVEAGERYEQIRDTIRADWKPRRKQAP